MQDTKTRFLQTPALWFGMMGTPFIWALHLYMIWAVNEFGCRLSWGSSTTLGINTIHALQLLISLIAGAGVLASGFIAYRNWQQLEATDEEERDEYSRSIRRGRFMAITGIIFAGLFGLVMLYTTVPIFFLPACSVF